MVNLESKRPKQIARAIEVLGQATAQQIMAETGVSKGTIDNTLNAMHTAHRIYVSGWGIGPSGHTVRVYSLGSEKDMHRPEFVVDTKRILTTVHCDVAASWLRNPVQH